MSKGSKQQYKQFVIRTIEDACIVLKGLIIPVIVNLEKFREYSEEAEKIFDSYGEMASIPADVYEAIRDKILYRQRELLRFLADHQSASFSYIDVRNILVKKGFLKRTLPQESNDILKELLNIRNWTFHNAQSVLVAESELAKKSIPLEMKGMIEIIPMFNPVVIRKIETYGWEILKGFVWHNKVREEQFTTILLEMKADYQELFDSLPNKPCMITADGLSQEVQYIEHKVNEATPKKSGSDIAALSMGIQKGKYDGSVETLKKLISEEG